MPQKPRGGGRDTRRTKDGGTEKHRKRWRSKYSSQIEDLPILSLPLNKILKKNALSLLHQLQPGILSGLRVYEKCRQSESDILPPSNQVPMKYWLFGEILGGTVCVPMSPVHFLSPPSGQRLSSSFSEVGSNGPGQAGTFPTDKPKISELIKHWKFNSETLRGLTLTKQFVNHCIALSPEAGAPWGSHFPVPLITPLTDILPPSGQRLGGKSRGRSSTNLPPGSRPPSWRRKKDDDFIYISIFSKAALILASMENGRVRIQRFHEFLKTAEWKLANITKAGGLSALRSPLFWDVNPDHFVLDTENPQLIRRASMSGKIRLKWMASNQYAIGIAGEEE
nr:hypothetical protein Iba_chr11fCG3530 [Ipomoea batatas]